MVSLTKLILSLLRRISTSDEGATTSSSAPTMRHVEGPLTMGVPCNPEIGVGLLAAMAEPTSSYPRVAKKPICTGILGNMIMSTDLCCNGACINVYCCGTLETSTSYVNKTCRLCPYRCNGARVYLYMGMMFCTWGCRFDYFMEALYNKMYMKQTGKPGGNQISAALKELLVSAEEEERGMMFCTRGCRFDYFMEALYNKMYMKQTGKPGGNQISAALKELLVSAEEERFRKIFFLR